jgi:hypothetical protein
MIRRLFRRLYHWLTKVKQYDEFRVKARIKVGRKRFKIRAKNYTEFLDIAKGLNHNDRKRDNNIISGYRY